MAVILKKKISLQDLPSAWNNKQQEDIIDGSNLTINPDIKFRRKRTVSKVEKYKRAAKAQEFLNYCRFRVGERETCDKPLKSFSNMLGWVKKGAFGLVPSGYREVIKSNLDLVTRAANADLRKKNKDEETLAHVESSDNTPIMSISEARRLSFSQWLDNQFNSSETSKPNSKYSNYVTMYKKSPGSVPIYVRECLSKHKDRLNQWTVVDNKVVSKRSLRETELKEVPVPIEDFIETNKPELPLSIDWKNKLNEVLEPVVDHTALIRQDKPEYSQVTLQNFFKLLKEQGATEITIKF